jgi:hypothetical protein
MRNLQVHYRVNIPPLNPVQHSKVAFIIVLPSMSWATDLPDSVFVLHRYDWMKRSTYLENLWLLWLFP